MIEALVPLFIIFAEPGFPVLDVPEPLPQIENAVVTQSVAELDSALSRGGVLVWRHGSAFPADAWSSLVRFLESGGSMLYLGGEPFTRPVIGPPGQRVVQPRTVSCLKALRLNQAYRVDVSGATLSYGAAPGDPPAEQIVGDNAWAVVLEPRLTERSESRDEEGAPGLRNAHVKPLAHLHLPGEDARFPAASAAYAIDRLQGRFAGGRWTFRLLSTPINAEELDYLLKEASRPATDLRVNPTLGCFHEGETPAVTLELVQPGADDGREFTVNLEVTGPQGKSWYQEAVRVTARAQNPLRVPLTLEARPGLYRVTARTEGLPPTTTGFWIFDAELFCSGDRLSLDDYTLLRGGVPEPVVGTTVMSETVHRDFLFEPNAAVWDDTFAELASLNVNLVRTGVWHGTRKIVPGGDRVDEAWLRALEAYYLSARRHGIPVLFTFFAFMPDSFGGISPYFDPGSLAAQRIYLGTVARRFASAKEMLWDLINEPSFSSPEKLWRCRPNGDAYESAAFTQWLRERYATDPSDPDDRSWMDVVRARWRLLPDEAIGLPSEADFAERHVMETHRPYRAKEYIHFAQDAFEGWVVSMTEAIRRGGSDAPITVGQDEGGLVERPNPLFHHRSVNFTSMHTWWNNDALLWDTLLANAVGKPLLISETGIMQRELLSGEAIRHPTSSAELLSRKIGYAFAGAFGLIQWCYEVNPYMASDNEVAIGLKRVDGSYKPEHKILRESAAFVARNRPRFKSPAPPEVTLVVPSADHFGPRNLQTMGTRRAVEIVAEELGTPIQVVSEYRTSTDLGTPKLIVLPACRGISQAAWEDILSAVQRGSVLHCSGWFETDDAGLPATRVGGTRRQLARVEPVASGPDGEESGQLVFPLEATQSWYTPDQSAMPRQIDVGQGHILHYALPLEWARSDELQRRMFAHSLEAARIPPSRFLARASQRGVVARSISFAESTLIVAINETSDTVRVPLTHGPAADTASGSAMVVPPLVARMCFVDGNGSVLDCLLPSD